MNAESIDEVLDLFATFGSEHYDEDVTQLDHALQTAALAVGAGASDALVASALLHDVGHLLELRDGTASPGTDDDHHESRGAKYLSGLFPTSVTFPIALHVRAKRYLCAVDDAYFTGLSHGSQRSLQLQGGAFEQGELAGFEQLAGAGDALLLRRWDDGGKVDGLHVDALATYRPMLERVAGG